MKAKLKGPIFLFLCAFFWGMAFSAQSTAGRYIGPNTFVWLRSTITCLTLLILRPALLRLSPESALTTASNRRHWVVGAICGVFLVLATILQQAGLMTTTTAKSGFITALYIVLVPILGVFLGKRIGGKVWLGVLVSLLGLYFLCFRGDASLCIGDAFTLDCALVFSIHILLIDRFGADLNSIKLSTIQFGTAAVISGIVTFLTETPQLDGILACWTSIVYAAVFSGALGYTFQIIGQRTTEPTLASLIMCLESVFAAFGGWIVLGETLSGRELLGCALMFSASVLALLPDRKKA